MLVLPGRRCWTLVVLGFLCSGIHLGFSGNTNDGGSSCDQTGMVRVTDDEFLKFSYVVNNDSSLISESISLLEPLMSKLAAQDSENFLFGGTYGPKATYKGHMDWMIDHVEEYTSVDQQGFRLLENKNGIKFEINDAMTLKGHGAGYFRLSAEVSISPELFIALIMDEAFIADIDETCKILSFFHKFKDNQTYLCYFRGNAFPGAMSFVFNDFDGLDITGFRKRGNIWYQGSMSFPLDIPVHKNFDRLLDLYWGVRLESMPVSSENSYLTKVTLVSQSQVNGMMPTALVNYYYGDVVASYIRDNEALGIKLIQAGKAEPLLKKFGLQ